MTVKLGANFWNQWTEWPALLNAGVRADELGYDTLWTWDHLYPIVGETRGPNYEGWLTITAWAARTRHVRIGLMVGANPYREPTLVAKMATTLDHISGGRAILGIGAAWNEEEAAPSASSSGRERRNGCAGWAMRCPSCAACSTAASLRRLPDPDTERRTFATCRRPSSPTCRSSSVEAARRSPCGWWPSTPT